MVMKRIEQSPKGSLRFRGTIWSKIKGDAENPWNQICLEVGLQLEQIRVISYYLI